MLPARRKRGWRRTLSRVEVAALFTVGESTGADNGHRSNLDRHRSRQRTRANSGPRVAPSLAKYLDEKIRRAVDNLWLLAEAFCGKHETRQLCDLFDVVEAYRRLHLREQVDCANLCPSRRFLDRHLVRDASGQPLVAFARDISRDVQQRPLVSYRNKPCLNV